MWTVLKEIGREAPAIAAITMAVILIGLGLLKLFEKYNGAAFDLKQREAASTGNLAARIMAMSAEQNKTIASQSAMIATLQSQLAELRDGLDKCVAACAQCHAERDQDRADWARERLNHERDMAALKTAIAAMNPQLTASS